MTPSSHASAACAAWAPVVHTFVTLIPLRMSRFFILFASSIFGKTIITFTKSKPSQSCMYSYYQIYR